MTGLAWFFAGVALVTAVRLVTSAPATDVVDRLLHLAMALGMLAMAWPEVSHALAAPLCLAFGAGAVWVAARALRPGRCLGSPWADAVLMGAMVGMTALMAAHPQEPPAQVVLGVVVLVAAVLVCGVVLAVDAFAAWRPSGVGGRVDHLTHVAMCLGMAVACWPMLGH